jgi:hypothetical protein
VHRFRNATLNPRHETPNPGRAMCSVCLEVEETLTNFRRTAINDYTTKMTSQDPAVREAAMQDPPALVVGDKQVCLGHSTAGKSTDSPL